MTDSNDQFQRLEEKLGKAIEIFKQAQADKRSLQQEVDSLRGDMKARTQEQGGLERELIALRRDREDVKERLEKLLQRLDGLIKPDAAGQ